MTTAAIVKVLTDNLGEPELSRHAKRLIVPRRDESIWTDEILDSTFADARQLAKQCAELKQLLQTNSELYTSQFTDALRKVAEAIQEQLEGTP